MNVVSLVLGIACLVFAIHSVQVRGCLICCTVSLGGCGLSLLCQLWELNRLAEIGDWAAIGDTAAARVLAGAVLLALVLGLNVLALLRSRKQKDCAAC